MSDESQFDSSPEESQRHSRPSSRRRHRHHPSSADASARRSRRSHYGDEPRLVEPVWDRSNWIFLLVLTNFISLAVGTHIGHRHWDDLKGWMGQREHDVRRVPKLVVPLENQRQLAATASQMNHKSKPLGAAESDLRKG